MRKFSVLILIILLLVLVTVGFLYFRSGQTVQPPENTASAIKNNEKGSTSMKIESPEFQNNQTLPGRYTCEGLGVNPPLEFSDVPASSKSLVLVVEDPDAPSGTYIHWLAWNISPQTLGIGENSAPNGATEGLTSAGTKGYVSPCPPTGTHHYIFKLYALDDVLNLPPDTTFGQLEQAMSGHVVASAQLTGLYAKNK